LANTIPLSSLPGTSASEIDIEGDPTERCVVASAKMSISASSLSSSDLLSSAGMGDVSHRSSSMRFPTSPGHSCPTAEILTVAGCECALGLEVAAGEESDEKVSCWTVVSSICPASGKLTISKSRKTTAAEHLRQLPFPPGLVDGGAS
jgi:hypothetical protein